MTEERSELLDDPTGGPSAGSQGNPGDDDGALDASAGAEGQDEDTGSVEDATDTTEHDNPSPG